MNAQERAQRMKEVRDFNRFGALPGGPVSASTAAASPAPVAIANVPEDIYSVADLFDPAQNLRSEAYPMPNGKTVWVHSLTPEDAVWLNVQALRDLKQKQARDDQEAGLHGMILGRAYQVVCCCRVGPEPGAARIFAPEHAAALCRNLGATTLEEIAALSDRLGSSSSQEREIVRRFFGVLRTWLETCSTQLTPDSLETWRVSLADCASCVSSMSARVIWTESDGDVEALQALLARALAPVAPEPDASEE